MKGGEFIMEYLFVYGTLLNHFNNEWSNYLNRNADFVGEGFFRGKLYDAGGYPAIVPAKAKNARIYGLKNPEKVLSYIDDYEQVGEDYEQPNEYVRIKKTITFLNGKHSCWIYIYNGTVNGLKPIKENSYPVYVKKMFKKKNCLNVVF